MVWIIIGTGKYIYDGFSEKESKPMEYENNYYLKIDMLLYCFKNHYKENLHHGSKINIYKGMFWMYIRAYIDGSICVGSKPQCIAQEWKVVTESGVDITITFEIWYKYIYLLKVNIQKSIENKEVKWCTCVKNMECLVQGEWLYLKSTL